MIYTYNQSFALFCRKEEALKVYRTALHYEPDNADVLYNVILTLFSP